MLQSGGQSQHLGHIDGQRLPPPPLCRSLGCAMTAAQRKHGAEHARARLARYWPGGGVCCFPPMLGWLLSERGAGTSETNIRVSANFPFVDLQNCGFRKLAMKPHTPTPNLKPLHRSRLASQSLLCLNRRTQVLAYCVPGPSLPLLPS